MVDLEDVLQRTLEDAVRVCLLLAVVIRLKKPRTVLVADGACQISVDIENIARVDVLVQSKLHRFGRANLVD